MNRPIIIVYYLVFVIIFVLHDTCFAQSRRFDPAKSYNNVGFSGGIYSNTDGGVLSEGTVYSLDYGQYDHNGIGCRGGVSYIDALDNNISVVQIPLSFGWRSPIRKRTVVEVGGEFLYEMGHYPAPNYPNAAASLFPFRLEFNVGVTPSYVIGSGYYEERWNSVSGTFSEGISVRSRLGLTLDAGARFCFRVWRFNILVIPTYHYWLTNNFTAKSTLQILQPSKSYLSFKFGLSYEL